ncbi:hypothetical protein LTR37_016274 [Vermiconidia calcicola]|uniref:Uncharacterized protein n=1 Tax=Vermiconidia calcicola TaxID=1690605 RepID=A0ACC3MN94_9PEZI|nr:hypothetical protein LTR37_016274 [Vermiconidia calcicola]
MPLLKARAEEPIAPDTELRILPLGDSITFGSTSADGNGYRLKLYDDLFADDVVFAGTVQGGSMVDNWMAGYPGKTIQYIAVQAGSSLVQNPNIVLLMAGTNDMNPDPSTSIEGSDAQGAAQRLGNLVDQILTAVPNTVVLVAKVPQAAPATQGANINAYNALIPGIVQQRASAGKHVQLVDMSVIGVELLIDGIHPTAAGYQQMGDIWYRAISAIPKDWIKAPDGEGPSHALNCDGSNALSSVSPTVGGAGTGARGDINANGGPDQNIPDPIFHLDKLQCEIALGIGHNGDWDYSQDWVSGGKIADGLGLDMPGVQLYDMDGDGRAEYLWVNETTGQLTCWKNNYPEAWSPCGNNGGIIASGAGIGRANVFFADLDGDGKTDYLTVNGNTGAVTVYWNEGPDANFVNGWRFTPGGVVASGVPHANLRTLRFADINGDGRADYVIVGIGGALGLWLNMGSGRGIQFVPSGGIAVGASPNIDNLVLEDINGDGRADYLVWDSIGGLSGFLNIRTRDEGTPYFAAQGGAKSIAAGITQLPTSIRLADIDGDGLKDYCYVDDDGALWIWWNRGSADTSVTGDGVRLADIDGDGVDDYIWLDEASGAPTVYLNKGPQSDAPDGWLWSALNEGSPIASGAGRRDQIQFGDIDGDNMTDYLVLNPESGEVTAYLNKGPDDSDPNGWRWEPVGSIAAGLGPAKNARFADLDGDGQVEYIQLGVGGKAIVWKNNYPEAWSPFADANAAGIGQSPDQISFADLNGNGKADYVWTDPISGQAHVYYNQLPALPAWKAGDYFSLSRNGVSGQNILYARLEEGDGAVPTFVNPDTGALAAFINGCSGGSAKRASVFTTASPHPKRELRRRAACDSSPVLAPEPIDLSPIVGCPDGVYDPRRPFDDPPCITGDWFGKQCDDESLTNALNPLRWFYADSGAALNDVMNFWKNYLSWSDNSDTYNFPTIASQYFHGPDGFQCEDIEQASYCTVSIQCTDVVAPAGQYILESLTFLHAFGVAVQDSLARAVDDVELYLDGFADTFSKLVDETARNLAIDGIVLAASIGIAGIFTTVGRAVKAAKNDFGEKSYEVTKDVALVASGSANGFAKDVFSAKTTTAADVAIELAAYVGAYKDVFHDASATFFNDLLDPRDAENQDLLMRYLNSAFLMSNTKLYDTEVLYAAAKRAIWGGLLTQVWKNSPKDVFPFVLRVPKEVYKCGESVTTATKKIPGDEFSFSEIHHDGPVLVDASFCDQDGNSYFLLDAQANVPACSVDLDGGSSCNLFEGRNVYKVALLPGGTKDVLGSPSNYGDVTIEDVVTSNWRGFANNGFENGFKSPQNVSTYVEPGTTDELPADLAYGGGINMPGFFNFPVCVSIDQYLNARRSREHPAGDTPYDEDPFYPCGRSGGTDIVDPSTYQ